MARSCTPFDITVAGDLEPAFAKVKKMADEGGVTFEGSSASGTFAGKGIEGAYVSAGKRVTITITKKPFIYPCSMIASRIRKLFEKD